MDEEKIKWILVGMAIGSKKVRDDLKKVSRKCLNASQSVIGEILNEDQNGAIRGLGIIRDGEESVSEAVMREFVKIELSFAVKEITKMGKVMSDDAWIIFAKKRINEIESMKGDRNG